MAGKNTRKDNKTVIMDAFKKGVSDKASSKYSGKIVSPAMDAGLRDDIQQLTVSGSKLQKRIMDLDRRASANKASETTKKKGTWNKEEVMRQRREAAKAAGKGNWNAEDEMRKRREAAQAKKAAGSATTTTKQKKSTWNKEEVMRQRREAARAAGKGNWNAADEMRKRREAAQARKGK